ncbi:EKC/KEOPS complex subunit GON7 [Octodon degus]|uniref:EKC/KEOPS complex subunit GON7 n=1 Tax=Octodon degus TaxID=10160 RepID=A0A6P3F9V6_OCTDE|nr:EKC/KEOPS complex subunit GON7 [Octodon degus]
MELLAEYVGPDRERRQVRVVCEASGDADHLQKLSSSVAQMKELVNQLFEPLVQQEAKDQVTADPDEMLEGNGEDGAEDENDIDKRTNSDEPSAKRPKTPS